jgi:toxin ParE1/3/4
LNTALRFLDRIDEKCELYATQPEMGTPRPDLADNVRCFPVGDYVVFYEPLRNGIRVLLVVHGSRDIPNVFKARFGERGP